MAETVYVTKDGWGVAYHEKVGEPGVTLLVWRHHESGAPELTQRGAGDGRKFPNKRAARRFALRQGYIQVWVP